LKPIGQQYGLRILRVECSDEAGANATSSHSPYQVPVERKEREAHTYRYD
jgi:hypothetical protein